MKKLLTILCLLLVAWAVTGQAIDPDKINLGQAKMFAAGADRVYVTNVRYGTARFSVLLVYDGANSAVIYGPWGDDDKLIQDYYEFGYASMKIIDDDTLQVSDIVLGNQGYSGRFQFDGVSKLTLERAWESTSPTTTEEIIAGLKSQLEASTKRLTEQLSATEAANDIKVKGLEAELAAAKQATATAQTKVTNLTAQLAATTRPTNTLSIAKASVSARAINPDNIDVSQAKLSAAGTDAVYITNIKYGGERFSVLLKYDGANGAAIYGPWSDDVKLIQDYYEFGHASMRIVDGNILVVSDLVLGNQGYSGRLKFDGISGLTLDGAWQSAIPESPETKMAELKTQLAAETAGRIKVKEDLEAELAAAKQATATALAAAKQATATAEMKVKNLTAQLAATSRPTDTVPIAKASVSARAINPSNIDMGDAKMSAAGTDSVYITNIKYGGESFSVLLKYDGANGAAIYGPWSDDIKLIQDYYEFGHASMRIVGNDTLVVSDIVLGNQGYSGRFKFDGVSSIALDSAWRSEAPISAETQLAELKEQLDASTKRLMEQLRAANTVHEAKVSELEKDLAAAKIAADAADMVYEARAKNLEAELAAARKAAEDAGVKVADIVAETLPSNVRLSGFTGGRSLHGDWAVTSAGAVQSDADEYFAKFMLPLNQTSTQTLYSIEAAADGDDFAGYGLHFYVSNAISGNGYGYGSSYLVWLTRDPGYYGTDATYVQMYRSYNGAKMIQLASVAVTDKIGTKTTTDVLYDRTNGTIKMSVSGQEYINLKVTSPLRSGDRIALRALGEVTFSDVTVSTR